MCSVPVGEGAKRVTTGLDMGSGLAQSVPQAGPLRALEAEFGREGNPGCVELPCIAKVAFVYYKISYENADRETARRARR